VERRYEFYVDKVQPTIDYLKQMLDNSLVSIVDAHQPITNNEGTVDIRASIEQVVKCIIDELNK
jgi:predicted YcjX-like family ATPase